MLHQRLGRLCVDWFRATSLFCGCYQIQTKWLGDWNEHLQSTAKVVAILFPGLVIGLANAPPILAIPALDFVLQNLTSKHVVSLCMTDTNDRSISKLDCR